MQEQEKKSQQLAVVSGQYRINEKDFLHQTDFTYNELDWLDVVYKRLDVDKGKNEINGSFTNEELKKTIKIILVGKDGSKFTDEDFGETRQSLSIKILADFFLTRAVLGTIIQNSSLN